MNKFQKTLIVRRMETGSCIGKQEHMSLRDANDVAALMSRRGGEPLIAYQCPFCRLFHVGHRKGRHRLQLELALKARAS